MIKGAFLHKNKIGIGLWHRKAQEVDQKWDFRALFSEIYMKIEVFSRLEQNYTSTPIAQLAAHLTFFI